MEETYMFIHMYYTHTIHIFSDFIEINLNLDLVGICWHLTVDVWNLNHLGGASNNVHNGHGLFLERESLHRRCT